MEPFQIVLDTNVLYAGIRSKRGASYKLLKHLNSGKFEINLSVPLVLEYEEVLLRKQPTLNFTDKEIGQILDYLCHIANLHEVYFLWRPILKDPKDDMILDLAVRSNCQYIVTYNTRGFSGVNQFGVQVVTAQEFLKAIEVI
ncbi:MAG: putative toxin-antitoxin system toxin component, PIN family [Balneolaceae bacterium]|nr:MAG: putative toxin-antitoxin system toxin component, PIN family [Balneolaceae bacterium]